MSPHFQRGQLLMQQGRHELAVKEFRLHLAEQPHDGTAHACLALSLAAEEDFEAATQAAEAAIAAEPDNAFTHYSLAAVMLDRRRLPEARRAIEEAIRFDPHEAAYFGALAGIEFWMERWPAALDAANRGLALEPTHSACLNFRTLALARLGRMKEAGTTIGAALTHDPEDPLTHATAGWERLQSGDRDASLRHFQEALRLDPTSEYARRGLVEAFKSRNFLYRLLLKFAFAMSRFSGRTQMLIVLGGYFGYRFVLQLQDAHPEYNFVLLPLIVAYVAFAYLTWLGGATFNLLLRFDREGRKALGPDELAQANWLAFFLFGIAAVAGVWWWTGYGLCLPVMISLLLTSLLVVSVYTAERGKPRRILAGIAAAFVVYWLAWLVPPIWMVVQHEHLGIPVRAETARAVLNWFRSLGGWFSWVAIGAQIAVMTLRGEARR